jgi:hypothetical protein
MLVAKYTGPRYHHTVKSKIEHVTRTTSGSFLPGFVRPVPSGGH